MGKLLNDNERFKKPSSDNDNVNEHKITDDEAERRVSYLLSKLSTADKHKKYLFKVAYKLPEAVYISCLDIALEKGRDPYKLFAHLTKREMVKRNVG